MEQHPEPEAVDDFAWSVVHKLVLCHFFQEGNKRTARSVANSVFLHFNRTAWVWNFEAMKERQPYQIGFMRGLLVGDMYSVKQVHKNSTGSKIDPESKEANAHRKLFDKLFPGLNSP